ncbi:hypothetical protein I5M27_05590 [Adhaeribacter sp. BT258]|uniref:DUF6265 domain-containing protein n=1 Tax=Adhaeribacter terrigena TaxID=2793070 RepID=A0ABS1BZ50_9BACT|nr:DUF6265 family protein [Adhaeribacter terrigena]MBK0402448.1 hypothetical protein [Adhaeribacter terrigena]
MNWLTGRWENQREGIKTVEIWERKPVDEFQVRGFMLEGTDTLFAESIKVASKKRNIFYTVTIPDQNNGKPVAFKLTGNSGSELIFENPEHDFPQKITYQKAGPDSVLVQIEGVVKNKVKKSEYYLKKTRN